MSFEQVKSRLLFLFPGSEEAKRVNVEMKDGKMLVTVDFHGMKTSDARKLVINIINIIRVPFNLDMIHGYRHGDSIRTMLYEQIKPLDKVVSMKVDTVNFGVSHAMIA